MKNKNSGIGEMIKLGIILVFYAVASCTVLAIVNSFTSVKIKQNQIEAANKAMKEVFSEADSFESVQNFNSNFGNITISDFYLAKKDGKVCGGVCQVAGPTYDKGKIIVGVDLNGVITGMQILELSDSPGFGLKANDPTFILPDGNTFYGQFTGFKVAEGFTVNQTFDGISGATITSKAIGDLVAQGSALICSYLEEKDYE